MGVKLPATAKYGADWNLHASDETGNTWPPDSIQIILLQEIRDELQRLNALLHCHDFTGIPGTLKAINRKIPVRRRRTRTP